MGGNVVEWTQSLYRPINRSNPYEDDDRNREDLHGERVARGGSWYSASNALLLVAYRDAFLPELRHNDLGFRVVARRVP
jgi:formylglycine-generating enzyme required for sulfatase activity